jgi:hypothetical protein
MPARESQATKFGTAPDRGAKLKQALPIKPKAAAARSVAAPVNTAAPTAAPDARGSAEPARASQTVPGAPQNVPVYLPAELLEQLKERTYRERSTYADVLIDAFDSVPDDALAEDFSVVAPPPPTSSGIPRRATRRRGGAGIQIQLRLDSAQRAWIDTKAEQLGAPSRSALVSAVLARYL